MNKIIRCASLVLFAILVTVSVLLLIRINSIEKELADMKIRYDHLDEGFNQTYKLMRMLDPKHYPISPHYIKFEEKVRDIEATPYGWVAI